MFAHVVDGEVHIRRHDTCVVERESARSVSACGKGSLTALDPSQSGVVKATHSNGQEY